MRVGESRLWNRRLEFEGFGDKGTPCLCDLFKSTNKGLWGLKSPTMMLSRKFKRR